MLDPVRKDRSRQEGGEREGHALHQPLFYIVMMRMEATSLETSPKKKLSHKSASNEFFLFHHRIMTINQKRNAFFLVPSLSLENR
jgi:hypothetical protein